MERALKEKLQKVVTLVDKVNVDSEIDIEYCIPGVAVTSKSCNISKDPYILVNYFLSQHNIPMREIHLSRCYIKDEAEKIADLVTFSIEQFKMEIDSVQMG